MLIGPGEPNIATTPDFLVKHLDAAVLLSFRGGGAGNAAGLLLSLNRD